MRVCVCGTRTIHLHDWLNSFFLFVVFFSFFFLFFSYCLPTTSFVPPTLRSLVLAKEKGKKKLFPVLLDLAGKLPVSYAYANVTR